MDRLPSFIVVGAQKAGTTTLHEWLASHPQISLPSLKETHFFRDSQCYERGLAWYLRQFSGDGIRGEVDPEYLFFPEAAERIKATLKSPKLIFVFRDPVERAFSHYQMSVRRGYENLTFAEALRHEASRLQQSENRFSMIHHSYASRGLYAEQVARFQTLFPRENQLYLGFPELFRSETGAAAMRKICDFIGADPALAPATAGRAANAASAPRSKLLRDLIYQRSPIKAVLGRLVPSKDLKRRIAMLIDRANQQPVSGRDPLWNHGLPEEIVARLREDATRLEQLTGVRLEPAGEGAGGRRPPAARLGLIGQEQQD